MSLNRFILPYDGWIDGKEVGQSKLIYANIFTMINKNGGV
jgi:hypothetical protein